jgi:hypothetical protein
VVVVRWWRRAVCVLSWAWPFVIAGHGREALKDAGGDVVGAAELLLARTEEVGE